MGGITGVKQNMRDFNAEMSFADRMKAIGALAYGHGINEGEKGGTGNIGLVGGQAIKFNTKWHERYKTNKLDTQSDKYKDMKESCDNLRQELRKMTLDVKGYLSDRDYKKIMTDLGFDAEEVPLPDEDGEIKDGAGLFKRTTAASVLKLLAAAHEAKLKAEKRATDELVTSLWDGHTPSYGNSVTAFNEQVLVHTTEVLKTLPQLADEIAFISKSTEEKDVSRAIAQHFPQDAKHIKRWLDKTCSFLLGLVPTNAKNKKALTNLKKTMDDAKSTIGKILDEISSVTQGNLAGTTEYDKANAKYKARCNELETARKQEKEQIEKFLSDLCDKVLNYQEDVEKGNLGGVIALVKNSNLEDKIKATLEGWLKDNLELMFKASHDGNTFDKAKFFQLFANGSKGKYGNKQIVGYNGYTLKKAGIELQCGLWEGVFEKRHKQISENDAQLVAYAKALEKIKNSQKRLEETGYQPKNFGEEGEIFRDPNELLEAGVATIKNVFTNMLSKLNGVKFEDGSEYPNLVNKWGTLGEIKNLPASFEQIYSGLQKVVDTFHTITEAYSSLADKITYGVKLANWKKRISKYTDLYDEFCGGTKKKEVRKAYLADLNEQADDPEKIKKLKELATIIVKMAKATYWTQQGDNKENLFVHDKSVVRGSDLVNVGGFESLSADVERINKFEDFKDVITTLCRPQQLNTKYGIFSGSEYNELPQDFPLLLCITPSLAKQFKANNNMGKSMRLSMEFFTRLHEVATTFGVINEGTGDFVKG